MSTNASEDNREIAYRLSNNLPRLLREFSRDYERRTLNLLTDRGYPEIRPSHIKVFANLGMGSVRVTELAERAQVTQQAMGKMLKELEHMGYIAREVDDTDRRAKEIRLTGKGIEFVADSLDVVDEVRTHYEQKIGTQALAEVESQLRSAVKKLELDYLPESWTDSD